MRKVHNLVRVHPDRGSGDEEEDRATKKSRRKSFAQTTLIYNVHEFREISDNLVFDTILGEFLS